MDAFAAGCQALSKMKTGGTQRVLVQHQQLVVAAKRLGCGDQRRHDTPSDATAR